MRAGEGNRGTISALAGFPAGGVPRKERGEPEAVVATLLFADVQGFSQLHAPELSRFVERFWQGVANLARPYRRDIAVRETWGDGLFFAILSVEAAGHLALELSELARDIAWRGAGPLRPLPLRIALHVGPVRLGLNPVTGLASCSGPDISHAARLEPKTPPGEVYASEAFAARTTQQRIRGFACHYVKELLWAKQCGRFPTYVVRRARRSRPILRVVRAEEEAELAGENRVKCG
ncbi:MAG: hypothetical protein SFU86_09435 [Pirellulaceae bacterium]|nr:hypothetical protein [Pirellulaceae bacterium]